MAALYPHTWTSALGDNPEGLSADTWRSALAGVTPRQLAEGLRSCVAEGREFPPSAGRFRAMCLGIPTLSAVKAELLTPNTPRSRFTVLVWRFVDAHAIRQADQRNSDRMLASAYEVAREQVMRGAELPPKAKAITKDPKRKPVPAEPEVALQHLGECRELLGKPEARLDSDEAVAPGDIDKDVLEQQLREHYASVERTMDFAAAVVETHPDPCTARARLEIDEPTEAQS